MRFSQSAKQRRPPEGMAAKIALETQCMVAAMQLLNITHSV